MYFKVKLFSAGKYHWIIRTGALMCKYQCTVIVEMEQMFNYLHIFIYKKCILFYMIIICFACKILICKVISN